MVTAANMSCWAVAHGPLPQSMPRGWGEERGQPLFPDVCTVSGGPRAKRRDCCSIEASDKLLNNLEKKEAWVIKEMVSENRKGIPDHQGSGLLWWHRTTPMVIPITCQHRLCLSQPCYVSNSQEEQIYTWNTEGATWEEAGALWKTLTECMSWFVKDLKDFENFIYLLYVCLHATAQVRGEDNSWEEGSLPHQVISVGSKCRDLILIYKLNSILSREELHLLFKFPQTKRQNRICI